jgi:Fe-S oxidoreductase
MARRAGNEYLGQMMIQQNVEVLSQYSPDMILAGCPHCYNTLNNEYPEFGAAFPVVHTADYFETLIREGRLQVEARDLGKLTYHDSCYLGRWNNLYDAPRNILGQANAGPLVEMERTRSKGFCCGAGGGRMFMEETLGKRINRERAEQVIASGATSVVTACPFCTTMINDGILEAEENIAVKDIAEILDEVTR